MKTREEALAFFGEHNKDEGHFMHAYAVEAAMKKFAARAGEDVEEWGLAGLLHDIDWEETGSMEAGHAARGAEMLREAGYGDEIARAVAAHGWDPSNDRCPKPETAMEKTLYTVDELTGLVTAVALVRPGKSLSDLEVKSVKKKWKDKGFARGVDRGVIERGAELMGEPLEVLIGEVIEALRPIEREIGLGEQ